MHTHNHLQDHNPVDTEKIIVRFQWCIILTIIFVAGEVLAGFWFNSLALLSDAGHNLADGAALGISWYALRMSQRASSHGHTFGFHRASILAALVNATTLILIALAIFYEGIHRLANPEPARGDAMIVVAGVAAVVNFIIAFWLGHGGSKDVNVRSAVIHMIGDALFSVGVVIAGVVVFLAGWTAADPLVSLLIGVFIIWSSWGILKETINILMEGTPIQIDMDTLISDMHSVPGVHGVHDLHVWTIASGIPMLTAHVVLENQKLRGGARVLDDLNQMLKGKYGIRHTTLQSECPKCLPGDLYCTLQPDYSHQKQDH